MPRGGARENAGRKKGAPNRKTQEQVQAIKDSGMTPLEYLLSVMRAPLPPEIQESIESSKLDANTITAISSWHERRIDAAKAAAPYVHPKLSQVEVNATAKVTYVVSPDPMTDAEWQEQYGGLAPTAGATKSLN